MVIISRMVNIGTKIDSIKGNMKIEINILLNINKIIKEDIMIQKINNTEIIIDMIINTNMIIEMMISQDILQMIERDIDLKIRDMIMIIIMMKDTIIKDQMIMKIDIIIKDLMIEINIKETIGIIKESMMNKDTKEGIKGIADMIVMIMIDIKIINGINNIIGMIETMTIITIKEKASILIIDKIIDNMMTVHMIRGMIKEEKMIDIIITDDHHKGMIIVLIIIRDNMKNNHHLLRDRKNNKMILMNLKLKRYRSIKINLKIKLTIKMINYQKIIKMNLLMNKIMKILIKMD